ncbi:MAG: ATP-binding protein [Caulobacteraceae bacterium]
MALFGRGKKPKGTKTRQPLAMPTVSLADMFQQTTSSEPALDLPRFSTNAADQPHRRDDQFAAVRMKLRAAYTPSQPVFDPRMFAGRLAVLKSTIRAIEDQRLHLVIYGERGIGKTSLLHMLTSAARSARYIVVYLSCGAASNFDETFRAVASEIPLLFHSDYAPTTAEAETGSSVANLLAPGPLLPRQFGDLCSKLTGTRVLIVLDEFDRATNPQFRRDVAELVKILSDRSARVQVVVAGVAADLAELVEHIPSVRRNILAIPIPLMASDEVEQLVKNGERTSGITVTPAARKHIVEIASGSPYIASLLCHHAALDALDNGRMEVTPADVSTALEQALGELGTRMSKSALDQVKKLAGESGSELLSLIASASLSGGGEFDQALLEKMVGSGKASLCITFAAQLASRGLLIVERESSPRKRYAFVEDAVPSYIWFLNAQQELTQTSASRRQAAVRATPAAV